MIDVNEVNTLLNVGSVHVSAMTNRLEVNIWLKVGDVTLGPTLYTIPDGAVPSLNQFMDEIQVAVEKALKSTKNKGPRQGIIPQEF